MKKVFIAAAALILLSQVATAGPRIESSGSGTGLSAGAVEESHLNADNSPTDEYVLSYESDTGGFEWKEAGGAGLTVAEKTFDSGSLVPDTCSGLLQNDSDPNVFDYLAFDGSTDEYATFRWQPPGDWDAGTVKAKFSWAASGAMTNGHTVIWGLNCYAVSDGDTIDVAFSSGEQTVSDAYATGDETGPKNKISSATSEMTVQGTPAVGDSLYCRVSRDADTDTSTIDAWLLNVSIQYAVDGENPAAW